MTSDQRPENAVVTDVHRQMADDFCTREVLYYDGNPEPVAQLIANVERATVGGCSMKPEEFKRRLQRKGYNFAPLGAPDPQDWLEEDLNRRGGGEGRERWGLKMEFENCPRCGADRCEFKPMDLASNKWECLRCDSMFVVQYLGERPYDDYEDEEDANPDTPNGEEGKG